MPLIDEITAVRESNLPDDEKRKAIYDVKSFALVDVIYNGKPAPGPIPPLIQRQFTLASGVGVYLHKAEVLDSGALRLQVTLTKNGVSDTHTITIVNPPVLPRQITGNEKQDLITAASEMLEGFV